MSGKTRSRKHDSTNSFTDFSRSKPKTSGEANSNSRVASYILLAAIVVTFFAYTGKSVSETTTSLNPITNFFERLGEPDQELLDRMGERMEEMGYAGLSREDLISLRDDGVTATFTQAIRNLGYTNIALDELRQLGRANVTADFARDLQLSGVEKLSIEDMIRLRRANVSGTFAKMMPQLGYNPITVDDLIRLRENNVTAHFTSNMHDLGYPDITLDDLIRLRSLNVTLNMVQNLINQNNGVPPSVEELIRYRISNQ